MLRFDNRLLRELPGDPETRNISRQVLGAVWTRVAPTPVAAPRLLAHSREVAQQLGLDESQLASPDWVNALAGNGLLPGMASYATCYGGHQFGSWARQLGDGRAIFLGEAVNAAGERFELQLKGAGRTPYSRGADGRAVLRSSIREFLCSEAMHHLGVPTTRALSLVSTGESVVRDMFYDGNPVEEPGAVVCRVAPSFLRFGHFELPASRGDTVLLQRLVDFTIDRDFPALQAPQGERVVRWFIEICDEYRQPVDSRADHRLRAVRLDRQLRSGVDAQYDRCAGPSLLLCTSAGNCALESRTVGRGAGYDCRCAGAGGRARSLQRRLQRIFRPILCRQIRFCRLG